MPMRIIGRGRDAYIVAGYLDKRGKWTPHWSERYFVLTPTSLHYFRKDRDQLFGDERGRVSLDKIVVKQNPLKRNMFEIKHVQPVAAAHDVNVPNTSSQLRHHTWILRANKESEAEVWIDAINEAQHKLTPELLAHSPAFQKLPPIPKDAYNSKQGIGNDIYGDGSSSTAFTNALQSPSTTEQHSQPFSPPADSDYSNTVSPATRQQQQPWQSGGNGNAAADTTIFSPQELQSHIDQQKRSTSAPAQPPTTSSSELSGSVTVSKLPILASRSVNTGMQTRSPPPPVSTATIPANQDPLLFAILEHNDTKADTAYSKSRVNKRDVLLGRNIEFGAELDLQNVGETDVIVAMTYDGTPFRIPVSTFADKQGEWASNSDGNLLRNVKLRGRYVQERHTVTELITQLSVARLLREIVLPVLVLLLCAITGGQRWFEKVKRDLPMLDLRPLWSTTEIMAVCLCASTLALLTLHSVYTSLQRLASLRKLTLIFTSSSLPSAAQRLEQPIISRSYSGLNKLGNQRNNSDSRIVSAFDNTDDSERESDRESSYSTLPRLPTRPDSVTAASLKASALTRGRTMSTVAEANARLIEQHEDDGSGPEESQIHGDDDDDHPDFDREGSNASAQGDHDLEEDGRQDSFPDPEKGHDNFVGSEELDRPIVKQDYFGSWTESDWTETMCRGANYMSDNKKIPAGPHVFRLNAVHCVYNETKIMHVSARPNSYANARYKALCQQRGLQEGDKLCQTEADFLSPLIVINFTVPLGSHNKNGNLLLYFTRRIHSKRSRQQPTSNGSSTPTSKTTQDNNNNEHSDEPDTGNSNAEPSSAPATTRSSSSRRSTYNPAAATKASTPTHKKAVSTHLMQGVSRRSLNSGSSPQHRKNNDSISADNSSDTTWATGEEGGDLDDDRLRAFDNMFTDYLQGTDEYRSMHFKLIPKIADGGWLVKKVVGGRPAIIAKGVPLSFFYSEQKNYLEITVDCHVSSIANRIMGIVNTQASKLVVDLTILFQGENTDQLPEALMGGCRLIHAHLDKFVHIDQLHI